MYMRKCNIYSSYTPENKNRGQFATVTDSKDKGMLGWNSKTKDDGAFWGIDKKPGKTLPAKSCSYTTFAAQKKAGGKIHQDHFGRQEEREQLSQD